MKKITIKTTLLALFIFIAIVLNSKSYAASANLTASSTKVEPGEKVTVTVNIKDTEAWNLSLSNTGGTLSGNTSSTDAGDGEISKQVILASFVANEEGTYSIALLGQITGSDLVKKQVPESEKVTITVAKKEVVLSNNATLGNLGINPYDFKGFKADTLSYNVTVPKEVSKINIYATSPKDVKGQTITGTGDKTLKIGENKFEVTVTAEDKKTTKTYTINITRESVSSKAVLSNLGIKPLEYDFHDFKSSSSKVDYTSKDVPYDVEEIEIYADSVYSKYSGTGKRKLDVGKNVFEILATSEDGKNTKKYTITVNRKEHENTTIEEQQGKETSDENNAEQTPLTNTDIKGLTSLEIEGLTISPAFSNDIYEYNTETTNQNKSLNIKTQTSSDKITVNIAGNENLKIGENLITILVSDSENNTTTTYQIIANVKQSSVDVSKVNNIIKDSQNDNKIKKAIIFGIIAIIIILAIIFVIYKVILRITNYNSDNVLVNEEDDNEIPKGLKKVNENIDNEDKAEFRFIKSRAKGRRYK